MKILLIPALALALATATSVYGGEPTAGDRETARSLLEKGDAAMTSGDARGALKFYEAAHSLLGLPATGMAVARAHVELGELVEARDIALSVLKIPAAPNEKPANVEARKEAEKAATDLAARIPSLELDVQTTAADLVIEVDGAIVPRPAFGVPRKVNPGVHVVRATASGMTAFESKVNVVEAEDKKVAVLLTPHATDPPTSNPSSPKAPPVVDVEGDAAKRASGGVSALVPIGFSIAGAGLLTGAIAGGVSLVQLDDAKAAHGCTATCPASEREALEADLDTSRTTAWVSNVGFIVAGVGAVLGTAGIVVSLTQRSSAPKASGTALALRFDGTRLALEGDF